MNKIEGFTTKIQDNEIMQIGKTPVITQEGGNLISGYTNNPNVINDLPLIVFGDHSCTFKYLDFDFVRGADGTQLLKPIEDFIPKYFFYAIQMVDITNKNKYERHFKYLKDEYIPLPPKPIQEKIIKEISAVEQRENIGREKAEKLKEQIYELFASENSKGVTKKLEEVCEMKAGKFKSPSDILPNNAEGLFPCYGGNGFRGFTKTFTHIGKFPLVGRQGALCGNVHLVDGQFHATEHALVVTALKDINVDWLYYLLKSMNLNKYATGTAQPGLSVKNINPLPVKVPTLKDQEKLIDKIKKLEIEIKAIETNLSNIDNEKEQILKKHLV